MNKQLLALGALSLTLTLPAIAAEKLPPAKVSMAQAKVIALKAQPGKIVATELEPEAGGSGLRYSFVIAVGNSKHEVGIDAQTGKVLENSIEGKDSD